MSEPLFSVLIPSRNNRERLGLTLDSIARTDMDMSRLEVIVVDDGSTDGTSDAYSDRDYPFRLHVHRVACANQSAATNEAIRRASGRYLLFSASDIIFDRRMFAHHLKWHEKLHDEDVVVLGYLPYAENVHVTPFMFYLVNGGFQFAYYLIKDPLNVPPNFIYAPNFSAKRELIEKVSGFDEGFPFGCQDTDLGIRMVEQGARIVYEPEAIGFHNHPVEMEAYYRRQIMAGEAMVHLEQKHPDYEGGSVVQDLVIQGHLMYSAVDLDRDLEVVKRIEATLEADRGYQDIWIRAFCMGERGHAYTEQERLTLVLVDVLFRAYNRILSFYWGRGYLQEALEVHGAEKVMRWIRARLAKGQASIQVRKNIEKRLGDLGLELKMHSPRDYRISLVVHGLNDYEAAVRYLEGYQNPPASRCNHQLVLVVNPDSLTEGEMEKLRQVADVVACANLDDGILEALGRCEADLVGVIVAGLEPANPHAYVLAERVFERMPAVGVLGGNVEESGVTGRRYGYRFGGEALTTGSGDAAPAPAPALTPVEVAIPEFCVVRGAMARDPGEGEGPGDPGRPWNFRLCDLAARRNQVVLHVPELAVRRPDPPSAASL